MSTIDTLDQSSDTLPFNHTLMNDVAIQDRDRLKNLPHKNELGEYESKSVQRTLDNSYVPESILEARLVQDRIIRERFEGKALRIADIGCGDGYHGEVFAPDCVSYHGFEISSEMAEKTRQRWQESGLNNTEVTHGDASKIELKPNSYDVAWSLYFTSGNFREEFDDISKYNDAYLDQNPAFIGIVSNFYRALRFGGRLFLTVYKDRPETEEAQRTFYKKTGQTVVTPKGSRFVATKENFWSVRWTEESMLSNLAACGIQPEQVKFNDLNDISWLVEVTKV
ncbi:class I SAM-dependent methyltransferase [Candidatus Pacearchaeota archaeon]|nr:class I SAM-dependent methyltransferase [Candidatus Pacearchaeota archaeon]